MADGQEVPLTVGEQVLVRFSGWTGVVMQALDVVDGKVGDSLTFGAFESDAGQPYSGRLYQVRSTQGLLAWATPDELQRIEGGSR